MGIATVIGTVILMFWLSVWKDHNGSCFDVFSAVESPADLRDLSDDEKVAFGVVWNG